jgi:Tfp pilus assembly protein PilV
MVKAALIALFVMSMGTLGLAASGLPVDDTVAAELR